MPDSLPVGQQTLFDLLGAVPFVFVEARLGSPVLHRRANFLQGFVGLDHELHDQVSVGIARVSHSPNFVVEFVSLSDAVSQLL